MHRCEPAAARYRLREKRAYKVADALAADPSDRCSLGKCFSVPILCVESSRSEALRDLMQPARRDNEWALRVFESNELNDLPGDGGHAPMAVRAVGAELKAVPAVHQKMASPVTLESSTSERHGLFE